MDILTVFGAGATIYTALNFIPARSTLSQDEIITETFKQLGIQNRDGLLPVRENGVWFLPAGLSPKDIQKAIPALSYQLNADIEMVVSGKAILFNIYPGTLPTNIPYQHQDTRKHKLGLPIGRTRKQNCYIFDLNDAHPYLIVAGAPGQGKSNALNVFLRSIAENYEPDYIQWHLVDLKYGAELGKFSESEYADYCGGTCWEPKKHQRLETMLSALQREIKRRMTAFRQAGVVKIDEYNALPDVERLPYRLIVIDEYAELRRNGEAEERLQSVIQTGRAAGIRCILCTQRPSATNLSTDIRGLIADRLCFRVPDRTNSEIVLDLPGAETLPCPGRCLLLHGADVVEAQAMRAP